MNYLWIVSSFGSDTLLVENCVVITDMRNHDRAQQIADEHNAWVILQEHGWTVRRWSYPHNKWGVTDNVGDCPKELLSYKNNSHDKPVQAVLAADKWLQEQG